MITPCDCCGSWTDCEKCDDPLIAKLMAVLDDPMFHHIHLCGKCEVAECNFTEPNGAGEHCADLADELIPDPFGNFADEDGKLT